MLDSGALELRQDRGTPAEIPPLAFDLLLYLIRHRDRIVSKDELFQTLWGDVVVSENSLSQSVWAARRAVHDTGGAQRVIKNIRGRGYRFVAELEPAMLERAPTPPPPEPSVFVAKPSLSPSSPRGLVGRSSQQARLRRALDALGTGEGHICVLSGEPGSGKSLLLQWLARQAEEASVRVLQGFCHDDAGAPPFWPWQQVVRRLVGPLSSERVVELAGDLGGELRKLVPEIEECLPDLKPAPERATLEDRFRLFDAVCELLARASADGPLVVVLEDLHWADEASLRLLEFATRTLPRSPVLLLASVRRQEVSPALRTALDTVLGRSSAELVELDGLDRAGVAELLGVVLPRTPADDLVERVTRLTGGNPFFVTQLGGLVAASRDCEQSVEMPREAASVVRRRLSHLPEEVMEMLRYASVLGNDFHIADLRRASELPADELLGLLEQASHSRIVEDLVDAHGVYRFGHPTIREAIHDDLAPTQRHSLHRRVADSLAEAYADDVQARVDEIALHYFEAALDGDTEDAVRFGELAGQGAFQATAYEESAAHYRRTLGLVTASDQAAQRLRARLLIGLGDALLAAESPMQEVRARFAEAAELASRVGDAELLAEAATRHAGRGALRFIVYREAGTIDSAEIELLERALTALGEEDSAQRALVCAWLACSHYNTGHDERRHSLSQEAIAIARRLGDARVLAETLLARQNSVRGPGELEERLELQTELVALTGRKGLRALQLDAYHVRAWTRLESGDLTGAVADQQSARRIAEELGEAKRDHRRASFHLMQEAAAGRLDEVERWLERRRDAYPSERPDQAAAIRQFTLLTLRGRTEELLPGLTSYAERFPIPVAWRAGLVASHALVGQVEEARAELERMRPGDFACIPDDHNWISSHAFLADAAFLVGDRVSAAVLYDKLLPFAGRVIVVGIGGPCNGSVERILGELAFALGRYVDAEGHFTSAAEINRGLLNPVWAAVTELHHARMLLELEPGSPRAADMIARARSFGQERGVFLLTQLADTLEPA